jgi:hypothetical protein
MRFKVLRGRHSQREGDRTIKVKGPDGRETPKLIRGRVKTYLPGDVVESGQDLAAKFNNRNEDGSPRGQQKFERLPDDQPSNPALSRVQQQPTKREEPGELAGAGAGRKQA